MSLITVTQSVETLSSQDLSRLFLIFHDSPLILDHSHPRLSSIAHMCRRRDDQPCVVYRVSLRP